MTLFRMISKILSILPDRIYLRIKYFFVFRSILHLEKPQTYSEKLQKLKVSHKNELYTSLVDKIESKKYVEKILGPEYIIPTLGIWSDANEINIDNLPSQFVLKCNHDSHSVFVVKDKTKFNLEEVKHLINYALNQNYYTLSREYPYKNVNRRVFAEKIMVDSNNEDLLDYKFFCFDGVPKFVGICTNRMKDLTWDLYDLDFKHIDVRYVAQNAKRMIKKPKTFEQMIEIASKLSQGMPHVRIDLYEINNKVYFGEFTFFSSGGFAPFTPNSYDYKYGEYITVI